MATVGSYIFSVGVTNNLASGGVGSSAEFPLANQTTIYTQQMSEFSSSVANATSDAGNQPAAADAFSGISELSQAGAQAATLSFSSLSMFITLIGSIQTTLIMVGIPPFVFTFAIIFISIGVVFAMLTAIFGIGKW